MYNELEEMFLNNFKEDILKKEEINGGWLTEKTRFQCKNYDVMFKAIEHKKIERRNIQIQKAAQILEQLNKKEIKCPQIYTINEKMVYFDCKGRPIVCTEYFKNTFTKNYKNVNENDIYNIANEVGKMNKCLRDIETQNILNYRELLEKIKEDYANRVEIGCNKKIKYI